MSSRIEQLIDEIEEYIDNCKYQPLSNSKIIVNKDEIDDLLRELRQKTPEEIKRYQKIISNKEAILNDAREKAQAVVQKLREMRLKEAAKKVEDGIEETLTYMDFPSQHWLKIRTNNVIERMNREIRRCTRVVGTFPDGKSALMLVCARLRYVSGKEWGKAVSMYGIPDHH